MIELTSTEWKIKDNEPPEVYHARIVAQMDVWRQLVRIHGDCYMVKFGTDDIRPMWEDQIDTAELAKTILSPTGMPLDCPLCQPYDNFNNLSGKYDQRRYLTKIVHPKYPEGMIDKEGVWKKCICLVKGEDRKNLKIKSTRNIQQRIRS